MCVGGGEAPLRLYEMTRGSLMLSESIMEDRVSLLAVAVKAMMGALHRARSPPMEVNAVQKLAPLQMQSNISIQYAISQLPLGYAVGFINCYDHKMLFHV